MIIAVMYSNWKIKSIIKSATSKARRQEIIKTILKNRSLISQSDIKNFLNPKNPQDISLKSVGISSAQVKKAIKRIKPAIKKNQLIYIYGDYDADGITATAILWEALNSLGANVMPYIPQRDEPVRGLSKQGIDNIVKLAKITPSLIITVDNGITSFKGCQYAKKQGIDVIITDHHQPKTKNKKLVYPDSLAVIHTQSLAGAGVAWFFSQQLTQTHSLDLVALGTIADMVPLTNANRSLTGHGLKVLKVTPRPGLKALAIAAQIVLKDLQTYQVSYVLTPRLNAMGRLDKALDSLRLLCTKNSSRAKSLAQNLNQTNQLRQDKTMEMFINAKSQYLKSNQDPKLIFVTNKNYHEGIVGLVAGRLVEQFNRPAVVVALGKNYAKASMRSIKSFNAIKAFRKLENLLLEHGGHPLAAGFTAKVKDLPIIQKKLEALVKKDLANKTLAPELTIDCQIDLKDINWSLMGTLDQFRPFGFANPQPIFASKKVNLVDFRPVGQTKKHLKLTVLQGSNKLDAIAFNFGSLASKLKPDQLIDIAYTIDENTWNGSKNLQLKIKDLQTVKI